MATVEGTVESRRDGKLLVRFTLGGKEAHALCTAAAALRVKHMHVQPGDRVRIEIAPGARDLRWPRDRPHPPRVG